MSRWWFVLPVLLILTGCGKGAGTNLARPVLTAVRTGSIPTIDGIQEKSAWAAAPETAIKTKNGPTVKMKAVYTGSKICFTATWPDITKNDIQKVWTYSDGAWHSGSPDDSFAVLWNINDSISGFNESGCDILCHKTGNPGHSLTMDITGPPPSRKLWSGRNQKGDMWDLSLGISNVKGTVSDFAFAINDAYLKSPASIRPKIARRDDKFSGSAPWQKNAAFDSATGRELPVFKYANGLSLASTPYPALKQMTPINADSQFKEGDQLPYMMFSPGSVLWQGSKNDMRGKAVWKNGRWTLEIERKLNTGEDDDVKFNPSGGLDYVFALAIFNATVLGHTPSEPVTLRFK
jgi:hypothetical protein